MTLTETITALESKRCQYIVEQRYDRLNEILSERLVHTHTRGNVDNRDSYLTYISTVIESIELRREDLQVIPVGDKVAILHGRQINRVRRRGSTDEILVEALVTQVFAKEPDDCWRMVAFHATALGEPPSAAKRG